MAYQQNSGRRNNNAPARARALGVWAILVPALVPALAIAPAAWAATQVAPRAEAAIAPIPHPPGDIPDSQVFIRYHNAAGYDLKVPEGWARSQAGADVRFANTYDSVSVTLSEHAQDPLIRSARAAYLAAFAAQGRAIKIGHVSTVTLPAGPALRIDYAVNSEPNAVTGKQIRLEANRYVFFRAGKLAALDLRAPYGADNVDQWRAISHSFRWQ